MPVRGRGTEINARHTQALVAERPIELLPVWRPGRDRFPNKHWRERADAATAGHTLSHTAKPRWGDHGFSVFPAIDL
jgi:hypothetical protein